MFGRGPILDRTLHCYFSRGCRLILCVVPKRWSTDFQATKWLELWSGIHPPKRQFWRDVTTQPRTDKPFHNFRSSKSVNRRILFSSGTLRVGFQSSKIVKGLVRDSKRWMKKSRNRVEVNSQSLEQEEDEEVPDQITETFRTLKICHFCVSEPNTIRQWMNFEAIQSWNAQLRRARRNFQTRILLRWKK